MATATMAWLPGWHRPQRKAFSAPGMIRIWRTGLLPKRSMITLQTRYPAMVASVPRALSREMAV